MMKAIVQRKYGDPHEVLEYTDVDKPTPGVGEVLCRVKATPVHPDVWHAVTGIPRMLRLMGSGLVRPRNPIPGIDFSGVVEAVGEGVDRFAVGDAVFGETHDKMQWRNGGTFAEYVAVPQSVLAKKPENVSFEEAGSIATSGYIVLLNLGFVREVEAGEHILVNGAAGNVGTIALQLAKAWGAKVTAVDSGEKADVLRELGADRVIDYRTEDFTQEGVKYDRIFDVASTLDYGAIRPLLTERGLYIMIGHDHFGEGANRWVGSLSKMLPLMRRAKKDPHLIGFTNEQPSKQDAMETLRKHLADGSLTPVVGRTYPLAEVKRAIEAMVSEEVIGRIVLVP